MKVLVCVDGSEYSKKTVRNAAHFAGHYKMDLTLMRVIKSEVSREKPVSGDYGAQERRSKEIIKEAEDIVSEVGTDINFNSRITVGPVSAEIVRIAEEEQFDTIWIGTRGRRGVSRMLLGSVADDVIHYAHCPVVVVR